MKTLTKKTRNILIGSGAGLLAVVAVALGIWQPWKKAEKPQDPPPQQQEVVKPQEPEKKGPSLLVGGEEIPCTIHEGDGWSILVPEGWTADAGKNHGIFTAPREKDRAPRVEVSCGTPGSGDGRYTFLLRQELSPEEEWRLLCFHDGGEKSTWEVTCQADVGEWDSQVNLLTAVARSFKLGNEKIFSRTAQANEPDWQEAEGKTVLWLDKDGLVLDDPAEEAVREKMKSWSQEQRAPFNGKYEFDAPRWMGSCCFGQGQYRDVFTSTVRYGLNEDAGEQILDFETLPEDGWIADPQQLTLVVDHQGDAGAAKVKPQWQDGAALGGRELSAGELRELEDYFNAQENNGLLRFPFDGQEDPVEALKPYLTWLFYDLGDPEEALSKEELAALEKAEVTLELDTFRHTREDVTGYLTEKLALTAEQAEELLKASGDQLGVYLEEFDAWYAAHGDTEMQKYTFDSGRVSPDGTITVAHTVPFFHGEGAEGDHDVAMTLVLRPTGQGSWQVVSHMPA